MASSVYSGGVEDAKPASQDAGIDSLWNKTCTETSSNVDPAVSDRAGNHMGSWWYMRERGMHPQAT